MGKGNKKKENGGQRRRGRKEQDHPPTAGSGKVPVNYTSEATHGLDHSVAYPNNKKGWLCWNMKSTATTLTHVSESRVCQSCLPFKSGPSKLESTPKQPFKS